MNYATQIPLLHVLEISHVLPTSFYVVPEIGQTTAACHALCISHQLPWLHDLQVPPKFGTGRKIDWHIFRGWFDGKAKKSLTGALSFC